MDNRIFVVARREYLERVRTRWFVIVTLAVPLLITGMMLGPAYLATRKGAVGDTRNIIILDATSSDLGSRVSRELTRDTTGGATGQAPDLRHVTPAQLPTAEDEATRAVMQKNGPQGYLVLTDSTVAGSSARYAGRNASELSDMDRIRAAVRQGVMMLRLEGSGVTPAKIDSLGRMSIEMPTERITEKGRGGSTESGIFVGIAVAFLLYMSIIFHGQNVLRSVLEEKTTRVAEVVISSVKPNVLLAGKVLGVAAVGLTQQLLWIGVSAYLMQFFGPMVMKSAGDGSAAAAAHAASSSPLGGLTLGLFVAVLLFFLVGFVFYASLYAAIGSMVNSEQEAQQAAMPVIFLLVIAIMFLNAIIVKPSGPLAVVLSWLPVSSPVIMPVRMAVGSVPVGEVIGSLLVGAVSCVGVIWLAARIYRVGMLMYGKKPSMKELGRWVRSA